MNDFTSPALLAMNIIRGIGDHVSQQSGRPIIQIFDVAQSFGGPNSVFMEQIFKELAEKKNLIPCLSGYHPHPLYVVCTHFPE